MGGVKSFFDKFKGWDSPFSLVALMCGCVGDGDTSLLSSWQMEGSTDGDGAEESPPLMTRGELEAEGERQLYIRLGDTA